MLFRETDCVYCGYIWNTQITLWGECRVLISYSTWYI
jgi:hypothetical protein